MKTQYYALGLTLTEAQKTALAKAARVSTSATMRLTHGQLSGDKFGLTKRQTARVARKVILLDRGFI